MAPKNLLKQAFRNILHQKSLETVQPPNKNEQHAQRQINTTGDLLQSVPPGRTSSWVEDQLALGTIHEASDASGTFSAMARDVAKKAMPDVISNSLTSATAETFTHLFQLSETMTISHLDTIETTLTLLEAMENLSPYVGLLRVEILEKKGWCEQKLRELQRAQITDG